MRQRRARSRTGRRAGIVMASAAAAVLLGGAAPAAPLAGHTPQETPEVDRPSGFSADVLAPHSTFPDEVQARFRVRYDSGGKLDSRLRDASSVVLARVTWAPGGTSGWHTHPGPVVVTVTEGEVEVTNADDCVARTYRAGEAFLDPGQGNVHVAANPSGSEDAVAYATFLGVPDGEPPTVWVAPADC